MSEQKSQGPTWVVFLVVGMMLNTLGIVLSGIGWFRYVLMALGLALLLTAVLLALRDANARGGPGGEPRSPSSRGAHDA
ncbi:MAG TPA: hypothetical protein VHG51_01090 [Longimicrobiaceae bacterium]|nr:hypothetical protein [Longimicrobiaceae bacterium]